MIKISAAQTVQLVSCSLKSAHQAQLRGALSVKLHASTFRGGCTLLAAATQYVQAPHGTTRQVFNVHLSTGRIMRHRSSLASSTGCMRLPAVRSEHTHLMAILPRVLFQCTTHRICFSTV